MANGIRHLSFKDRKKILEGLKKNQRIVVVKDREGHGVSKVYGFDTYVSYKRQMVEAIQKHKPWLKRQKSILGSIGERPLNVTAGLSRTAIYEAL